MFARSRTAAWMYLLLFVLAEVVDRDMGATTESPTVEDTTTEGTTTEDTTTVGTPMEVFTTEDLITNDYTTGDFTTQVLTTTHDTTTVPHSFNSTTHSTTVNLLTTQSTTVDMLSFIQERNSLKQEADSLRIAVIILGITTALAVITAIILAVCLILKRRRSDETAGTFEINSTPTNNRNNGAAAHRNKTTETTFETDTGTINKPKQKTFDEKPVVLKKPKANEYANNEETMRDRTKKERADNSILADPPHQRSEYKLNNAAGSNVEDEYVITDETESPYEEVHQNVNFSKARESNNSKTEGVQNKDASEVNHSVGVYANFKLSSEAGGNYSGLDTSQVDSHYYN